MRSSSNKTATTKKKATKPSENTKRSTRDRFDWITLKAEFLKSEHNTVYAFMKEKYDEKTARMGNVGKATRGWTREKELLKLEALENVREKAKELYTPTAEELSSIHKGIITLFKAFINAELERCISKTTGKVIRRPNLAELQRLWNMIKAEKLEPTIVKDIKTSLNEDERALLDSLIEDNIDDDED